MNCKKSALLLLVVCLYLTASSQSFVGYGYDNYSGVNGVLLNPGSLADSKYKVNVNIFAISALAGNNAYELDRSKLLGLHFSNLSEGNGYYKSTNTDYKYAYFNTDILGPSATISLTSKDALGLITRARVIGNVYNLGNPLFQLMGNSNTNFYNTNIINRSLQNKVNSFAEAGVSYGRVLMKNDHAELKIGITGKYIVGLGYGSVSSGQMSLNLDPANNIANLNADVTAQYSGNLDNVGNGTSVLKQLGKNGGKGIGLDFGFVYEWKKSDPSEYKMRLGMSVTDIGSVKYTNSPNSQTYTMTADGHNTSEFVKQDGETYDAYINRLKTNALMVNKSAVPSGKVNLPTAVHLNIDYQIYKRLYIDADVLFNTIAANSPVNANYVTTFTVTPRLEKKWLSIYSPVSYNVQGQLNWGAGVRFGPLFVGSGSVLSSMLKQRIQTADAHIGLTIPIFQHDKDKKHDKTDTVYRNKDLTHDRDGDGVVDEKDECPDSAGPIALIGCPDRDGDGVADKHDKCPDVKGSPNFQGCPAPDTDGDSVNDDEDKCPLVPGLRSNYGCPPIRPELISKVNHAADRIFFVRAKAIIEKNSLPELDRVVYILQSDSVLRLRIEGNTDSEGTDERNQRLSMRRARAVFFYLQKQGIPAGRMDYIGYGSKHPIAPNETREGMAQNRRVEMILMNYPKDKK
jgi:outer membrane protein OmpA-like peptidoglycan-associated protein